MGTQKMKLYGDRIYGENVSDYGLENGYLDYYTLAKIVGDMVLNNNIFRETFEEWELVSGEDYNEEDDYMYEVYQYYIITPSGAAFLEERTNEVVYYNDRLDMYLWGITHFGTSWDYVLTDIEIE